MRGNPIAPGGLQVCNQCGQAATNGVRGVSRRFLWLAVAIVLAIGAYTAGWFYAADRVLAATHAALARMEQGGDRGVCEGADVRGYPFRIGLFCRATFYQNNDGASVSTGALRSAAQIYNPWRAIVEADPPARLTIPGLLPVDLDWESLRSSLRLAQPIPERVSLEFRGLTASADIPGQQLPNVLSADVVEVHARPNGTALDLALRFTALSLGEAVLPGRALPPMSGLLDLQVAEGLDRLREGMQLRGSDFVVRQLDIADEDGAGLTASGTISVGEDGLVDAQLQLAATNPEQLSAILGEAFPEARSQIDMAFVGLSRFGVNPTLPLTIEDGEVYLTIIRVGQIPPL